jgi:hypothetical protein
MSEAQPKDITFLETVDHLGGWKVVIGSILLLAAVYLYLVEWFLPGKRSARVIRRQVPSNKKTSSGKYH